MYSKKSAGKLVVTLLNLNKGSEPVHLILNNTRPGHRGVEEIDIVVYMTTLTTTLVSVLVLVID